MPIYELNGQGPEFPGTDDYWVAETAVLIGRIRLKRQTSVWFGAVLRGDNEWIELGEGSQIQDNCTLHTDPGYPMVIGKNCVIDHAIIDKNVVVPDGCLIGVDHEEDRRRGFTVSDGGVTAIGKGHKLS